MGRAEIDLNADLGEGALFDDELLDVVTSAAVACGFHAGSPQVMVTTARAAANKQIVVGAHPSYEDREGFGRRPLDLPHEDLVAAIVYQIGAMAAASAAAGTNMMFVKPHGALYNQAATEPAVADAMVEAMARCGVVDLALLCPAGSELSRRAVTAGISTYSEAFADRAYAPDGNLVTRSEPGSVLEDAEAVVRQAVEIAMHDRVVAVSGDVIKVRADSICLHGDTPGAALLARAVRRGLEEAGVSIAPFLPAITSSG